MGARTKSLARGPVTWTAAILASVMVLVGLSATPYSPEESPAAAADLSGFDPGFIISDEVFFDKWTMTESEIQQFFVNKIGSCASGATCLINWRGDTFTRAATARCNTYTGASGESAARVIYKVAQACGINPRVLLVMLQKEQGLITKSNPSAYAWRSAMGYGCPDTAPCDAQYYGFYNQVYNAAAQMQRYTQNPNGYNYRPGRWNTIQWKPGTSCGTSEVFILNQATANLYIYTPYRPNAAALAAGYGVGDGCSSYGNRNFYNYFTDWFGPTTYYAPGAIGSYWRSIGSSASIVGSPFGNAWEYGANGGGWAQQFTKGYIYVTKSYQSTALLKSSELFAEYARNGSQNGPYGWPLANERCSGQTCLIIFQKAAIASTPEHGIQTVTGNQLVQYAKQGYERGALGAPISAPVELIAGGVTGTLQSFVGGVIYDSPVGTAHVSADNAAYQHYLDLGGPEGAMGWPTSSQDCAGTSCWITFENGLIGSTPTSGVYVVDGESKAAYDAQGGPRGALGAPISAPEVIADDGGGTRQRFAGGYIYSSSAGTVGLRSNSGLTQRYISIGGPASELGWPTTSELCGTASCSIGFTRGLLGWTMSTGVHSVQGRLYEGYEGTGGPSGTLGLPTSVVWNFTNNGGGSAQGFERGYIYASGDTVVHLRKNSALFQTYAQLSSQYGTLGWPLTSEICITNACYIEFQNGVLAWNIQTGTHRVLNQMAAPYKTAGGPAGALGIPLGATYYYSTSGGAYAQNFQNGYLYVSGSKSAYLLKSSDIFGRYSSLGSQNSRLGWPTASETCVENVCTVPFQRGTISSDQTTGEITVLTL